MSNKFYAYHLGKDEQGIVETWDECKKLVEGKKARYKGFKTRPEAEKWLEEGASYDKIPVDLEPGIYFDAGTGRGDGVEVRVTDELGVPLLKNIMDEQQLNAFGNYLLSDKTNNYGELMGCFLALKIAMSEGKDKVFGDSKLILDYWSKGHIKKELPEETRALSGAVMQLKEEFESTGGRLARISGDDNPADIGFHR